MKKPCFAWMFAAAMAAAGCGDDGGDTMAADASLPSPDAPETGCSVTPGAWSAPNFATNASTALALRAQLDTLVGTTMRGAEEETVTVDEVSDLAALYDAGTPSLSSVAVGEIDTIMTDVFTDFVAAVLEGPQDLIDDTPAWDPGANGGIASASTRAMNVGGLEVRQLADKGLFGGGVLYPYALSLTEGTITADTIDSLAAAWGTDETLNFENRTDSANYSYGMGYHAAIAEALTDAKAYAADAECVTERDAAIVTFFRTWELALIARAVFYVNAGNTNLAAAADDDARIGALHGFAEGVGLAMGFYGMEHPASGPLMGAGRLTTDADIEALMTAVGVNLTDLSGSTVGSFIGDSTAFQTGVTAFEARVMTVFGVSTSDLEAWRSPTAG